MQSLRAFLARHSWHARVLGKILVLAGAVIVLGALFARAGHPTGLVPDGPVALGAAALLVVAGLALTLAAEKAGKR